MAYAKEISKLARNLYNYAYETDYYNACDSEYSLDDAWGDIVVRWRNTLAYLNDDIVERSFYDDTYSQSVIKQATHIIERIKALHKLGAIK